MGFKDASKFPSLQGIIFLLEAANSHPSQALKNLRKVSEHAQQLVQANIKDEELIEKRFAPNQEESEIQESIETFMQNTLLLIDNHQEL